MYEKYLKQTLKTLKVEFLKERLSGLTSVCCSKVEQPYFFHRIKISFSGP